MVGTAAIVGTLGSAGTDISAISTSDFRNGIEVVSLGIEIVAVAIITIAIAYATILYVRHLLPSTDLAGFHAYREYKVRLGRALLVGLELLVAADIVRTVALEPTIQSVLVLAILVLVRTFLSWSLVVELEQRWPWQKTTEPADASLFEDA